MTKEPILILQMQRMGDLVLSFPLLGWLGAAYPDHPLWMVGEPDFFDPLLELSPKATYFSYAMAPNLETARFKIVINLSHRAEAAALAGRARCETRFGPWRDADGGLHINGDWQLYRASLTQNNRLNLYHWADLNALDCIPETAMRRTVWPRPRPLPDLAAGGMRIGLFLGASQAEKHPDAAFWAGLAKHLLRAGHKPALLGGPQEAALGRQTAALIGIHSINLCGRFSVGELARFLSRLDLLISPDTGPMHIAAWLGTPVLNLSLGPVSAWETGPRPPGHHVLRADLDCAGCWQCYRERQMCRDVMTPGAAMAALERICGKNAPARYADRGLRGLELLRAEQGSHGLYALQSLTGSADANPRHLLARFWQAWFGEAFGRTPPGETATAFAALADGAPDTAEDLREACASFALVLAYALRGNAEALLERGDFWREAQEPARPFAGYAQMLVQNGDGGLESRARALAMAEQLAGF